MTPSRKPCCAEGEGDSLSGESAVPPCPPKRSLPLWPSRERVAGGVSLLGGAKSEFSPDCLLPPPPPPSPVKHFMQRMGVPCCALRSQLGGGIGAMKVEGGGKVELGRAGQGRKYKRTGLGRARQQAAMSEGQGRGLGAAKAARRRE